MQCKGKKGKKTKPEFTIKKKNHVTCKKNLLYENPMHSHTLCLIEKKTESIFLFYFIFHKYKQDNFPGMELKLSELNS